MSKTPDPKTVAGRKRLMEIAVKWADGYHHRENPRGCVCGECQNYRISVGMTALPEALRIIDALVAENRMNGLGAVNEQTISLITDLKRKLAEREKEHEAWEYVWHEAIPHSDERCSTIWWIKDADYRLGINLREVIEAVLAAKTAAEAAKATGDTL